MDVGHLRPWPEEGGHPSEPAEDRGDEGAPGGPDTIGAASDSVPGAGPKGQAKASGRRRSRKWRAESLLERSSAARPIFSRVEHCGSPGGAEGWERDVNAPRFGLIHATSLSWRPSPRSLSPSLLAFRHRRSMT